MRLRFAFALRRFKHSQQTNPPIIGISPLGFATQALSSPLATEARNFFLKHPPNVPRDWE
jgi:hypothetical protein